MPYTAEAYQGARQQPCARGHTARAPAQADARRIRARARSCLAADRRALLAALDAVEADARAANLWLLTAPPPETAALDALVEERQDANRQLHAELQRVLQAAAQAAAFQP